MGFVEHLLESTNQRIPQLNAYLAKGKQAVDAQLPAPFDVLDRDEGDTRQLVDVGGANGPFSVAALLTNPELRSTVFDLPQVERFLRDNAKRYRLDFRRGDFFADPLPTGDCVAFGYVLSAPLATRRSTTDKHLLAGRRA